MNLPVAGGVDQKTAQEWLDPTQRVAAITNGNAIKIGVSDKRIGMGHLSTALLPDYSGGFASPTTTNRVASWSKQNLAVMQPGGLYAYSDAESALVPVGALPPCATVRRPITVGTSLQTPILVDFPAANGTDTLRLIVYEGPTTASGVFTVYASLYDVTTGDIVFDNQLIYQNIFSTSGSYPVTAFYCANAPVTQQVVIAILDLNPTGLGSAYVALKTMFFDPASNIFSGATVVANPSVSFTYFDIAPWIGDPSGGFIVAYCGVPTGLGWGYAYWAISGGVLTQITTGTVDVSAPTGFSVAGPIYVDARYGANERIYFWYEWIDPDTPAFSAYVLSLKGDKTYTTTLARTLVYTQSTSQFLLIPPCRTSAATAFLGYLVNQNFTGEQGINSWNGGWGTVNDGGFTGPYGVPLGTYPVGRPFSQNGVAYLPAVFSLFQPTSPASGTIHSQQGTLYLMQAVLQQENNNYTAALLPCATVAPRQVDLSWLVAQTASGAINNYVPASSAFVGTRYAVAIRTNGSSFAGNVHQINPQTPTWACDFLFDTTSQELLYRCDEMGQELRISGATPFVCDGGTTFEDNFFYYPEFSYVTQGGSGGTLSGTYGYAVCYVYQDAAGKLHRSVPVFALDAVTGATVTTISGSEKCTVHFPAMTMTWRDVANPGQVYAEIYRTTSNGAIYYLLDRKAASGNATAVYLSYGPDVISDASIQTATILYTTGGVVDQPNPPTAALQCVWIGRLFLVDETLRNVWFTQADSPGVAAGWNEAFTFALPDGGDITAMAPLNSYLVLWKKASIWVISGQNGPSATAQGSDLTIPQKIVSDVGCVSWPSVVLTPTGYLFQAPNGIYQLDTSLNVTYIGKNVQDTLAAYPVVTSATLVPNTTQVRFTCQGTVSSLQGFPPTIVTNTVTTTIVYDYLLQEWLNHSYGQLATNESITSSCIDQNGLFAMSSSAGNLWREKTALSATRYQDDDSTGTAHFVSQMVTSAWVNLQTKLGYVRARLVQIFGERLDDCGLTVSLAVNYDPTVVQTFTWNSGEMQDILNDFVEARVAGCYAKVMAIQATVSDTLGSATTSGQGCRFVSFNFELDALGNRYRQIPTQRRA